MSMNGISLRAYRPSRFVDIEPEDNDNSIAKQSNLELYISRAAAGMPLFDAPQQTQVVLRSTDAA